MKPADWPTHQPDYRRVEAAARNQWSSHVPLYEHIIEDAVIEAATGNAPFWLYWSKNMHESVEGFRQYWDFWRVMGYDTASMEFLLISALEGGGALGAHADGCIKTRADFERYPWKEIPDRFFASHTPYIENFIKTCPPGMKAVGGVGNGLFEAVQDIVGYTNLCYISVDDPQLYADLFSAMGEVMAQVWARFMQRYADVFCVLRFGDDLGFKQQTLLPPKDIRAHILPQYKRVVDIVHAHGKPFLLHSCGCIFEIMDDLIDTVGIDAKHSNEDQIAHFKEWVRLYGQRIGNFGGIDMDVLCRAPADEIQAYVKDCLDTVQGCGGIAFGTGNSVPNYVPPEGYFAMVEAVRRWRGDFD